MTEKHLTHATWNAIWALVNKGADDPEVWITSIANEGADDPVVWTNSIACDWTIDWTGLYDGGVPL